MCMYACMYACTLQVLFSACETLCYDKAYDRTYPSLRESVQHNANTTIQHNEDFKTMVENRSIATITPNPWCRCPWLGWDVHPIWTAQEWCCNPRSSPLNYESKPMYPPNDKVLKMGNMTHMTTSEQVQKHKEKNMEALKHYKHGAIDQLPLLDV